MFSFTSLIVWNTGWSAVLAVLVFLLGQINPFQRRPALMHLLWFGVLLRLISPAVVLIPILQEPSEQTRQTANITSAVPQGVAFTQNDAVIGVTSVIAPSTLSSPGFPGKSLSSHAEWLSLPFLLIAVSLTGTCMLLMLCLIRGHRFSRVQRTAHEVSPWLAECVDSLAREMGMKVVPHVRMVDGLSTPSIYGGWRRSTILLPQHLIGTLSHDQWKCVISHELAHLARGDLGFNLVAVGVLYLFWWNPVAWWAWREMRACQEASCDAIALSRGSQSRRLYAQTLLQVMESWDQHLLDRPQVLLGFGHRSVLTRRFEMIGNPSVRPRVAVTATISLATLALTFFCLPVRAEKVTSAVEQESSGVDQLKWGSLKGQIVLEGDLPSIPPLDITKESRARDLAACGVNEIPDEKLVIDPETRGIANVFVVLASKPATVHPDLVKNQTKEVQLELKGCRFQPHALIVCNDQQVRITSEDGVAHNVHTHPKKNNPVNVVLPPHDRKGFPLKPMTLVENTPYQISSDFHPWMTAYWINLDHPYAAVTDAQGNFEIPNLPVGEHEFMIWQESSGWLNKKYSVTIKEGTNQQEPEKFSAAEILK